MEKAKLHFQRFEFKYYLPRSTADKLIPSFLNYMEWDPYVIATGSDFYEVNSLYFDSPEFGCYFDKEAGVKNRKKLRLRFYNQLNLPEDPVFVEIKRKYNALVVKDRVLLTAKQCNNANFDSSLTELYRANKESDFFRELVWFKARNCLRPTILVSYNRKPLVSRSDKKLRVTFDFDLRAGSLTNLEHLSGTKLRNIDPHGVILEIKFNNILPAWLHDIIRKYQLQNLAYSKYCNALRLVKPRLNDNSYSVT